MTPALRGRGLPRNPPDDGVENVVGRFSVGVRVEVQDDAVGRGFTVPDLAVGRRFFEHGLYYVRVPPSATGAIRLVPVVSGPTTSCRFRVPTSRPPSGFFTGRGEGGSSPRILTSGGRVAVVAWHYDQSFVVPFDRGASARSTSDAETTLSLWTISGATVGPRTTLALREWTGAPRFETFASGPTYQDPPLARDPASCRSGDPVLPAAFDVAGLDVVAAFDSLSSRGEDPANFLLEYPTSPTPTVVAATPSTRASGFEGVSSLRRVSLDSSFGLTRTRLVLVDSDVGETVGLSAWRDSAGELSLSYFRRGGLSDGLTYAEERATQFLVQRGGPASSHCAARDY